MARVKARTGYRFTPARRAGLHKAQLASARKRHLSARTKRNIRRTAIGVGVVAGTGAAVVGVGMGTQIHAMSHVPTKTQYRKIAGYSSTASKSKIHVPSKYTKGQFNPSVDAFTGGKYNHGTRIKGYYRIGTVYHKAGSGSRHQPLRGHKDIVAAGYKPHHPKGLRTSGVGGITRTAKRSEALQIKNPFPRQHNRGGKF